MSCFGIKPVSEYFDPRMLALLEEIYKKEPQIRSENDLYSCYARSGVEGESKKAEFSEVVEFIVGISTLMEDLGGLECSLQSSKRSFSEAHSDILAISKNNFTLAQINYAVDYAKDFFYVNATGGRAREAVARVAIHILQPYVSNALRVLRAIAEGLTSLHSCKVCGPNAIDRTDHICVYLYSIDDVRLVQALLMKGYTSSCIGGVTPPAMKVLQTGVAYADEPPNVPKSYVTNNGVTVRNPGKYDTTVNPSAFTETGIVLRNRQRTSFGEFHTNRIWAGLIKWRQLGPQERT